MSDWHASDADLAAFSTGTLPGVVAASVETHLVACDRCRIALRRMRSDAADAREQRDHVWAGIADRIDRPTRDWRGHRWLQVTIGSPALCLVTAALVLVLLTIPVVAAAGSTRAAVAMLFAVAPLAPVVGAVLGFRSDTDPGGELAMAAPLMSFRLVLARAAVVSAFAIPAAVLSSVLMPVPFTLVIGWILPGLAFSAVVLACASRVDATRFACALAVGWAVGVVVAFTGSRRIPLDDALNGLFVNQLATQVVFAVAAVVAATVVYIRRADQRIWST